MKIFFVTLMMMTLTAWAEHTADHKTQREHKAHKHGSGKINIAFQGPNGEIDFEAPTEGIYGFEYVAKSEEDKKKQHDALALIETNIIDMIQFAADIKCEISKQKIEIDQHEGGKHSDIDANFKVICQKSPIGTVITFNIQKTFPKLKDVKIDLIADDFQKSFVAKKDGSKLVLKK